MKSPVAKIKRRLFGVMVPVFLLLGLGTAGVSAGIGDSKQQVEAQYGAAWVIEDTAKRMWTRQEWQDDFPGKAAAYGYWSKAGHWPGTLWVEYDAQGIVVKETLLFDRELRLRDFRRYFGPMYDEIVNTGSVVFTKQLLSGDSLGAVVQKENNRLNYIRFFMVPDGTKTNMHSKFDGFEITEITPQAAQRHFADRTWRKTDNYFTDKLYFSENLVPRKTTEMIVIHHTAREDMSLADIHELHLTKCWAGIGYHKVILPDGTVGEGRPERMIGAHALGANRRSIGIVVDGNFEEEAPSSAQMDSLVQLTQALMGKYHVSLEHVLPHRAVTQGTACPGRQFPWKDLIQRLENKDKDPAGGNL